MTKWFNKIKISMWPLIFLTVVFSGVFLTFLIRDKYIYCVVAFLVIYLLSFKVKIPKFPICLFLASMLTKIIVICIINPPVDSDFLTMYEASKSLRVGNLDYTNWNYFIMWGYQVGHVLYQAILLKICNSVFFLKLVNCFALSGTTVIIYLTVKELFNEQAAKFSSLSYLIYLHPVLLTTVLTNQHVPTFLFFLSFYILINDKLFNKNQKLKFIIAGVLIGIGNIMRPEGIVFILTTIIYIIIIGYKNDKIKNCFIGTIIILISYLLVAKGSSLAFQVSGISKSGLSSTDNLWKFVLGTNYESQGWYRDGDTKYLGNSKKEMEVIKSRTIERPLQFAKLLVIKAEVFWIGNNLYWSNTYLYSQNLTIGSHELSGERVNEYLNKINEQTYFIIFILFIFSLIYMNKNKYNEKINLFIILICVYFSVYLFIEIMIRYTYTPRVAIFMLSGIGMCYLNDIVVEKINCKKSMHKNKKSKKQNSNVKIFKS